MLAERDRVLVGTFTSWARDKTPHRETPRKLVFQPVPSCRVNDTGSINIASTVRQTCEKKAMAFADDYWLNVILVHAPFTPIVEHLRCPCSLYYH